MAKCCYSALIACACAVAMTTMLINTEMMSETLVNYKIINSDDLAKGLTLDKIERSKLKAGQIERQHKLLGDESFDENSNLSAENDRPSDDIQYWKMKHDSLLWKNKYFELKGKQDKLEGAHSNNKGVDAAGEIDQQPFEKTDKLEGAHSNDKGVDIAGEIDKKVFTFTNVATAHKSEDPINIYLDWGYSSADFVLSNFRALESLLGVYPNARVEVITTGPTYAFMNHFGNSLPFTFFQKYQKRGYNVQVHIINTRQGSWMRRKQVGLQYLLDNREKHFWYNRMSHEKFVATKNAIPKYVAVAYLRFMKLYETGGVFADFTTLFIRPIPKEHYGYSIQPSCSVKEASGKYWEPSVMHFPKESPVLACVLKQYDDGFMESCAEKSNDEGAACVREVLELCKNKESFKNVLEDSGIIQWFECASSKLSTYFEDKSTAEDYTTVIQDERQLSAFWLGPPALNGMWVKPQEGSFTDIAFKNARKFADRWEGRQNESSCSTICHHYQPARNEHDKEILAGKMNCAPGFMVPGTQKGASTFLFHALTTHPQVLQPLRGAHGFKETGRYLANVGHGGYKLGVRLQAFPFIEEDEQFISGDGTVTYMFSGKGVPQAIFKDNPYCKFVFALRNPVERAFSDYRFLYGALKHKSFNEIAEGAIKDLTPCFKDFQSLNSSDPEYDAKGIDHWYKSKCGRGGIDHNSLVKRGLYYFQVLNFINTFGAKNIYIVDSGEMKRDQRTTLNGALKFLGLCDYDYSKLRKDENVNQHVKLPSHHQITEEMYLKLQKFYAPFNKRLYHLIGRDLNWETDKFRPQK